MARIILVHGAFNELWGPNELKSRWLPAVRDGLWHHGVSVDDDGVEVCFYGDLFRRMPGTEEDQQIEQSRAGIAESLSALAEGGLDTLSQAAGDAAFDRTVDMVKSRLNAVPAVLHMIIAGLLGTLVYKWLKGATERPRPYQVCQTICCLTAPLDRFSFPSGHTLHAVVFSLVATAYYPALGWLVWPFTALVALSRLVLGLHYVSDVLVGALLGGAVAALTLAL